MQKRRLNHTPGHRITFKKPEGWVPDGDRNRCQAWSRQNGRQCYNSPKQFDKWCRMHYKSGIGAPGNKFALKYGLYEVGLHEDEKELWPHLKTGDLTDEINLCRLNLRRHCRAQKLWEEQRGHYNSAVRAMVEEAVGTTAAAEFFHLETVEVKDGTKPVHVGEGIVEQEPFKENKVIRRRTDFAAEIKSLVRTIRSLEETQLKLMEEGGGEDYARRLADDIRAFGDTASTTLPGGVEFGGPLINGGGIAPPVQPPTQKRTL